MEPKTELTYSQKQEAFLTELTALSHKYGVRIGGCGCCDSPYLVPVEGGKEEYRYSVYANDGQLGLRSPKDIEDQEWWNKD